MQSDCMKVDPTHDKPMLGLEMTSDSKVSCWCPFFDGAEQCDSVRKPEATLKQILTRGMRSFSSRVP